jgi:hypothetical protein
LLKFTFRRILLSKGVSKMFATVVAWVKGLTVAKQVLLGAAAVGTAGYISAPLVPKPTAPTVNATQTSEVKEPVITTKTESTEEPVAFEKQTIEDGNLAKGKTELRQAGVSGVKTSTFTVTLTDGAETKRELAKEEVTTAPINEVTAIGTYVAPAPSCDPNYSGACVPIASDVDCGGGSGNGPEYVYGTVTVIGYDIYDLDRDGDGYGCE